MLTASCVPDLGRRLWIMVLSFFDLLMWYGYQVPSSLKPVFFDILHKTCSNIAMLRQTPSGPCLSSQVLQVACASLAEHAGGRRFQPGRPGWIAPLLSRSWPIRPDTVHLAPTSGPTRKPSFVRKVGANGNRAISRTYGHSVSGGLTCQCFFEEVGVFALDSPVSNERTEGRPRSPCPAKEGIETQKELLTKS